MLTDPLQMVSPHFRPQLWCGPECTINRVGDQFRDQLLETGHYDRGTADIHLFGALGMQAIRYPLLWERHQPVRGQVIDWTWAAQQLAAIGEEGLTPVIGLVHHGSGPAYTDLLDPSFARGLADYGRAVATRFPWIKYYTPVNEPLTTARFSGLYGLWYPHHSDAGSMAAMLLNELKATVLTMAAIRQVNPDAKLVQTEDLAKTHSTPLMAYQADFENERRWLTYRLLCGQVDPLHPMYTYFRELGIPEADLQFFLDNPCPPDIMGLNYYITSERYLDESFIDYPAHTYGGNGIHQYADTEAVRSGHRAGLKKLLQEAWEQFHLPVAVTEVHIGCTWEERVRWFKQAWDDCCGAREEGVDVRAITAWALLGSYDWNSLLTCEHGYYEPGVFDAGDDAVSATPFVRLLQSLSSGTPCFTELLNARGWWEKEEALHPHCSRQAITIDNV